MLTVMIALWSIVVASICGTIILIKPKPKPEPPPDRDSVERRDEMMLRAAWHREQLDALAQEFVKWHDC